MIYSKKTIDPRLAKYSDYSINLWVVYIFWSTEKHGWFRLFRDWWGITWKHKDKPLFFSERYGYTKSLLIFNYRFKILKPSIIKFRGF